MQGYPKIDRPCPYKANLDAIMDGSFCTMCSRIVVNLDAMTERDQTRFFATREDEVCVRYSFRPAIAVAALAAASMVGTAAMAQDAPSPEIAAPAADVPPDEDLEAIIVGGIKDPKKATFVEDPRDVGLPTLTVVYEDEAPSPGPTS